MKKRLKSFFIINCLIFIILISRLAYLQLVNGEYYSQQAENVFSRVYREKATRGEILARDGQKLATNIQSFNIVYTDNRKVVAFKDIPSVLLKLIRTLKNNTADYNKLILDTVPFKINGDDVSFYFEVYVNDDSVGEIEEDEEKQKQRQKELEEKRQKILKAKEERFKKDYEIPLDFDAKKTFYELLTKYGIASKEGEKYILFDNISLQEARDILALRIVIDKNRFLKFKPVVLASNVSKQTAFYIASKSEEFPNLSFIEEPIRYYPNGDFATHVLGYLKRIDEKDAEFYKNLGYDINSELIGGAGLEATFENISKEGNEYNVSLRGEPKEKYITVDKFGNQVKLIGEVEDISGDTIVTTIDYNLQKVAEQSLEKLLNDLQTGKVDGKPKPFANRGAVVVVDVKNGEILALASKPSFDPNLFAEFGTIKEEETRLKIFTPEKYASELEKKFKVYDVIANPLINYATKAKIPPGSTFKLFTSVAALEEGIITPNTTIIDRGQYDRLPGFKGACWIWPRSTHGAVNVAKALQVSCNYFYFYVSHNLGWDKFTRWLEKYGLKNTETNINNIKTGIEIEESPGTASNIDKVRQDKINEFMPLIAKKLKINKEDKLYTDIKNMFLSGKIDYDRLKGLSDSQKKYIEGRFEQFNKQGPTLYELLNASIGQGKNQLTPIQMAQFYMTVVNGGNRYKIHLVKEVLNPDGSVKMKVEPEVISKVEIKPETYKAVMDGLRKVAEEGTAASILRNYPISNGGKTGTAEVVKNKDIRNAGIFPNAWYVGVAPMDNPQIVVVALAFNAEHGSVCANVVRDIYDQYFGLNKEQPKTETTSP